MKRIESLLLVLLALCLAVLSACEKETKPALPEGTVYAGEHIAITQEDLDRQLTLGRAGDENYSQEDALHDVTLQVALAWKAQEAGLPNEDADYFAYLDLLEETYSTDPQALETLAGILRRGYDRTPKEYFTWARTDPVLRRSWYGETYTRYLKEQFQNGEAPRVSASPLPADWNEYYAAYKDQLVQAEHVQKVN